MSWTPHSARNQADSNLVVPTGGEILDDGTILELVEDLALPSGLALLKWDGCESSVSPELVHRCRTYIPLTLNPTVRSSLRLPSRVSAFGSTETLYAEMMALLDEFTNLSEAVRQQLAVLVLASWLADCLPTPITVYLWSPISADGARVLLLLGCLCRLPLVLAGVDARDIRALPSQLPATLLLLRPASSRGMREVMASFGWCGFRCPRSGMLVETLGAKVFSGDMPLSKQATGPIIEIPIMPSRRVLPVLDRIAQEQIAEKLLPQLLYFRLTRCEMTRSKEKSDVCSGDGTGEAVGRFRACFRDAPELGDELSMLLEVKRTWEELRLADPHLLMLEVLLNRCHEPDRAELHVAEIAADMNAGFFAGAATSKLSARLVGYLLKSAGFTTQRLGQNGRGLRLVQATRRLIHRLAGLYHVPSAERPFLGCKECAESNH